MYRSFEKDFDWKQYFIVSENVIRQKDPLRRSLPPTAQNVHARSAIISRSDNLSDLRNIIHSTPKPNIHQAILIQIKFYLSYC